jgi:hypothetical protein
LAKGHDSRFQAHPRHVAFAVAAASKNLGYGEVQIFAGIDNVLDKDPPVVALSGSITPQWRSLDGYLHYDVNYLLIADNLLDFCHFLQPTTVGGSADYASVLPKLTPETDAIHDDAAECRRSIVAISLGRRSAHQKELPEPLDADKLSRD